MRADVYLVFQGFAESRNKASRLIGEGVVFLDGRLIGKPSESVDESLPHNVSVTQRDKFVGRGGQKLEAALDAFGIDVSKGRYIDVGASTGGFTECLLLHGARQVTAVDSGHGQLHKSLLSDSRVISLEGYNARNVSASDVGIFDGAVMDVSFISQTAIIPALVGVIKEGGFLVSLIKPQFEAGRSAMGKNGVVKSRSDRLASAMRVLDCARENRLDCVGIINSPIHGGEGNVEYLAYFIKRDVSCERTPSLSGLE